MYGRAMPNEPVPGPREIDGLPAFEVVQWTLSEQFRTIEQLDLKAALVELASAGKITWEHRKYEHGDVAGAWVVIVADTSSDPIRGRSPVRLSDPDDWPIQSVSWRKRCD